MRFGGEKQSTAEELARFYDRTHHFRLIASNSVKTEAVVEAAT
jgi:hypothetical protein